MMGNNKAIQRGSSSDLFALHLFAKLQCLSYDIFISNVDVHLYFVRKQLHCGGRCGLKPASRIPLLQTWATLLILVGLPIKCGQ
jgi:hypothetical protein